ncbi:hypothetical protein G6O67_002038 [Ophiocordyceps sinensis]|uniref:Uncharacterized protein n=2 Tax=Ophiocordyceps sinensis TaxID=72228 RepID=A0A8H4V6T0_9HYPO|nr:hypothetical protein OCS_05736 [Ophiocordyceps sinensis CO18]KAF4510123.1 hypothetical protein G6O67_002038 [Ophiocordyceps sinensis]
MTALEEGCFKTCNSGRLVCAVRKASSTQFQNDCKNIYSTESVTSKGAVAEDVRNGEPSFPIVVLHVTDQTTLRLSCDCVLCVYSCKCLVC